MFAALRRVFRPDPHANLREVLGHQPLPTFPATVQAVLAALRDPETSLGVIGDRLAEDPALTVDVLKTVNSAAYGLRRPVSDAAHAARMLGRSELEALVLARAVRAAMPTRRVPGYDPAAFWRTAAERAALARGLAEAVQPSVARMSYTATLLQDVAVPLLAQADVPHYRDLLTTHRGERGRLQDLERSHLDFDHAMVSGWLCEAWAFPEPLQHAIAHHHDEGAPAPVRVAAELEHADQDTAIVIEAARAHLALSPEVTLELMARAAADAR